jgi:non-ribosomal peptide synthase protein (TIGR01720 family)
LEQVGIHDNFFDLGGDSILSIQIITRAKRAGVQVSPRQLFQHQTIAELATVAGTAPTVIAEQGPVSGTVPLTPIQRWFFETNQANPHHFNQSIMFEITRAVDVNLLSSAMRALVPHHDALRLRFSRWPDDVRQVHAEQEQPLGIEFVDLSALDQSVRRTALESATVQAQASLNFSQGPLLRAVLFDLGEGEPRRLLMIIHHLVIDTVSWRVLMEDLWTAYQQLASGESLQLSPKTTSFKYWAQRLTDYAASDELNSEIDYWTKLPTHETVRLPIDRASGDNSQESARTVHAELTVEETSAVLQRVPRAYRTQINDVLLTALAKAITRWTGSDSVWINLEGHGREPLFDDVDLTRTVGWFTTMFPVYLKLEGSPDPGKSLDSVKEQLRKIPNHGIGYGLLRYLSPDREVRKALRSLPQPEISFNYLGQFSEDVSTRASVREAKESRGSDYGPQNLRAHVVEVNGSVNNDRLQFRLTYSKNIHQRATIERVAQVFMETLRGLVASCEAVEENDYSPFDFPDVELSPEQLEKVIAELQLDSAGDGFND